MLHIFYNICKTLDSSGFPVILPNPNRITKLEQIARPKVVRFFVVRRSVESSLS